jgi:hypothetical protein
VGARTGAAIASATVIAVGAVVLTMSGGSPPSAKSPGPGANIERTIGTSRPELHGRTAREDCATRSEASFPGAFRDPRNLVVGPLVLVGGAFTDAGTVRKFGGNKFPLLVKAGHVVTVQLGQRVRRVAGLAYGPLPQGEVRLRDAYRAVTFVACRPGKPSRRYSIGGPSGSYADGISVTFWSGFVLARVPTCVPLDVYVDGETTPRHAGLSLGERCS